jgi:hypothetical protein
MATEEEDLEETEEEEEEEQPSRTFSRGRSSGGGGGSGISGVVSWASQHRVPLMIGGGFLLAYWVGHRRGRRAGAMAPAPVTQIYLPPQAEFRTGIQSSSPMYDPRFYDYPQGVDAY